jgi:hypothetical protein
MAKKSRPTFKKREKEKARVQKQQGKEARRLETKELKANTTRISGDEDPDIAGIRPGPQPLPDQWNYDRNGLITPEEEA